MSGFTPTENIYTHVEICRQSMIDNNIYENFKNNPYYTGKTFG